MGHCWLPDLPGFGEDVPGQQRAGREKPGEPQTPGPGYLSICCVVVPGPRGPGSERNPKERVSWPFLGSSRRLGQLVWGVTASAPAMACSHRLAVTAVWEVDNLLFGSTHRLTAAENSRQTKGLFPVSPSLAPLLCLPWLSGGHLMSPLPPSPGPRPPAKTLLLLPSSMEATIWPSRLQNPA